MTNENSWKLQVVSQDEGMSPEDQDTLVDQTIDFGKITIRRPNEKRAVEIYIQSGLRTSDGSAHEDDRLHIYAYDAEDHRELFNTGTKRRHLITTKQELVPKKDPRTMNFWEDPVSLGSWNEYDLFSFTVDGKEAVGYVSDSEGFMLKNGWEEVEDVTHPDYPFMEESTLMNNQLPYRILTVAADRYLQRNEAE